jgi:hypothetical protein
MGSFDRSFSKSFDKDSDRLDWSEIQADIGTSDEGRRSAESIWNRRCQVMKKE